MDSNEGERTRRYHVFRDPRSEQVAERLHSEKCHLAFDQAVNEFNSRGMSFVCIHFWTMLRIIAFVKNVRRMLGVALFGRVYLSVVVAG